MASALVASTFASQRTRISSAAALAAITREAARVLGVGDRVGTLEPGKDADLVAFDGDPLQITSRVVLVMVDGRVEWTSTLEEPES